MNYPDSPISLPDNSRHQSVEEWVAFQAAAHPDAVALSQSAGVVSYRELDERAAALATVLKGLGVGPETVVGICAHRSAAMVIGSLATWKAGGAYLPLDPLNPDARLATMADDAQILALVTIASTEHRVPGAARPTIVLDELGRIVRAPIGPAVPKDPAPSDPTRLAYVIYTSGSTGTPNGVEVTHENLLHLISWHQKAFQVSATDRASQIASVGFDAAVWEVWPYLATGSSVHIPDDAVIRDPESLRDWLVAEGITISFVPTPMAELMMNLRWPEGTALRRMLIGAEALHRYPREGLPFQLINNYGPTECTVVATSGRVPPGESREGLPPIGLPIGQTRVLILDESGHPAPEGAEGELYIGGPGVARGYRNRPELTAKRFVSDTMSASLGGRLFRTGDLVRILADGQISFVRRIDDQTKVRGFRVEPSEIGAILNRHPKVLQGLVVARQAPGGDRTLVGYLVSKPDGPPTPGELREFMRVRLPDYMVPDKYVRLERMPLSSNGKLSRNDLPEPDEANTLRESTFTAPRTEVEKTVAAILAGLLGVDKVDVEGNFFVLGGHSLLGAQLIARVRKILGVEMSLRVLFAAPTVASLSIEIERLLAAKRTAASGGNVAGAHEPALRA
jgi:amino acid adenylation domain-containing protein